MTTSRDPDRVVRAWLDLMPSEAPDRAIDAVLQTVETTPQVRQPLGAPFRRPFHMNRPSLTAAAAAIVVVLVAGAFAVNRFAPLQNGGASPSPATSLAASPGSSPEVAVLPAVIQGTWFGAPRTIAGAIPNGGTQLHVGPDSIGLTPSTAGDRPLLSVTAGGAGGKLAVMTGTSSTGGCEPGQAGQYGYALSPSGQTMTITADQDACAQRQSLLAGTWWFADCHTQDSEPCLGVLDPGDVGSQYFASTGAHGVPWVPRFGALSFTVPAGWASDADFPNAFSLTPAADYAATQLHGDPAEDISVYSHVVPESQATPCSGQADKAGEVDAAAYVAWLRTVRGLSVGAASTVTVGGRQATMVDITVPHAPTRLCDGTDAVIEYLLAAGWYAPAPGASTGTFTHAIGAGNADRLILVDMPSGYLTAIVVTTNDAAGFDGFVQQAMPIVATFRFTDAFPTP